MAARECIVRAIGSAISRLGWSCWNAPVARPGERLSSVGDAA